MPCEGGTPCFICGCNGNAEVLEEPNTVVLCRSVADKYFGHWQDALGQFIAVSQMNYVSNADMGFNKESVLILNGNNDSSFRARQVSFKQELLTQGDVQAVSFLSLKKNLK